VARNVVLVPKLFSTLQGYTRKQFLADVNAGVIVGIVALPLAIAFAIASGVPPERGLYTAIVAGFLISLLGGSRVQIGGPTGAFVVIVYGIVQQYGYDGLSVATIMAGAMLAVLGLVGLGGVIKFIPHPVTTGFTAGIALIIFTSQITDLLGFELEALPADFVGKWGVYFSHVLTVSLPVVAVSATTLAILVLWPRLRNRVPGPFVALVVTSVLVQLLHLPVDTIGSRFGEIHATLPLPRLPSISWHDFTRLVQPAFTIALLGGIESLLSAVVADGMIGSRHRSNMELVAQGVANIASPIFGGIPATGALARTATNVRNGGRTPVAGMVHALFVLLVMLFFGKWVALIPMATLSGILVVVAYHMSEWRTFRAELRSPRSDVLVLLTTFFLTVLVDLTVAVEVGIVLAAFLFMKRMSDVANVRMITDEMSDDEDPDAEAARARGRQLVVPAGVQVYDVNGPFFFGAAESFKEAMLAGGGGIAPRVLILRMRQVPTIDATGISALRDVTRRSRKEGTAVILCGVDEHPRETMARAGLVEELGAENFVPTYRAALALAERLLAPPVPPEHLSQL
jgi:SulP family sulfate permease